MQDLEEKCMGQLQEATEGLTLTDSEEKTLHWLAGCHPYMVDNVAHIIERAREPRAGELTRQDLLQVWGYLQTLKDIFEKKARDTAKCGDNIGDKLTADYMKEITAISTMQQKLSKEAGEE